MPPLNAGPNYRWDDPLWFLLAEFSLSELFPDHEREELTAGRLSQTLRALGMPPECMEKLEKSLAGLAQGAGGHFRPVGPVLSAGGVRIFCQRKIIDNRRRAASQLDPAGQAVEPTPGRLDSVIKLSGGWGYFLIERGGVVIPGFPLSPESSVDLYLYREGE